jgi:uncharacterized protein YjbJ (UPF0337 family)
MNDDQVKGKAKEVAGRVERQAGEWTGDKDTQREGASKEVEGKAQHAWGETKDRVSKAADELTKDKDKDKDKNAA